MQVGYKITHKNKMTKPEIGHCKKAGAPPCRHLVEWKVKTAEQLEAYPVGSKLKISELFQPDQLVDVAGTTVGKGTQGAIKRWNHARGPMTHGALLV